MAFHKTSSPDFGQKKSRKPQKISCSVMLLVGSTIFSFEWDSDLEIGMIF